MTKRAGGKNRTLYTQRPDVWRWAQRRAETFKISLSEYVETILLQHKTVVESLQERVAEREEKTSEIG